MSPRSKVELYEQIRKARQREEPSIRTLARRFHVHRRDVRQALASAVPPDRKAVVRPSPVWSAPPAPEADPAVWDDRRRGAGTHVLG